MNLMEDSNSPHSRTGLSGWGKPLRSAVRMGLIELGAVWSRWRSGSRGFQDFQGIQFVNIHHVTQAEEAGFVAFVDWLQQHFQLLSYSQAVDQVISGTGLGPRLVLSFDDGLENHWTAARLLAERNVSACFFVCPGIVGQTEGTETERFCRNRLRIDPTSFLNWGQIDEMLGWGHEIGSHTMDHLNLAQIDTNQVLEQLQRSREVLQGRIGAVQHFAWPYGRFHDFSATAFRSVFEIGYRSCASGVRGCHLTRSPVSPNQLCLHRDQTEIDWPQSHRQFFLWRSTQKPMMPSKAIPPEWLSVSS